MGVGAVLPVRFQGCCRGTFLHRERSASRSFGMALERTRRQNERVKICRMQREGLNVAHELNDSDVPEPFERLIDPSEL